MSARKPDGKFAPRKGPDPIESPRETRLAKRKMSTGSANAGPSTPHQPASQESLEGSGTRRTARASAAKAKETIHEAIRPSVSRRAPTHDASPNIPPPPTQAARQPETPGSTGDSQRSSRRNSTISVSNTAPEPRTPLVSAFPHREEMLPEEVSARRPKVVKGTTVRVFEKDKAGKYEGLTKYEPRKNTFGRAVKGGPGYIPFQFIPIETMEFDGELEVTSGPVTWKPKGNSDTQPLSTRPSAFFDTGNDTSKTIVDDGIQRVPQSESSPTEPNRSPKSQGPDAHIQKEGTSSGTQPARSTKKPKRPPRNPYTSVAKDRERRRKQQKRSQSRDSEDEEMPEAPPQPADPFVPGHVPASKEEIERAADFLLGVAMGSPPSQPIFDSIQVRRSDISNAPLEGREQHGSSPSIQLLQEQTGEQPPVEQSIEVTQPAVEESPSGHRFDITQDGDASSKGITGPEPEEPQSASSVDSAPKDMEGQSGQIELRKIRDAESEHTREDVSRVVGTNSTSERHEKVPTDTTLNILTAPDDHRPLTSEEEQDHILGEADQILHGLTEDIAPDELPEDEPLPTLETVQHHQIEEADSRPTATGHETELNFEAPVPMDGQKATTHKAKENRSHRRKESTASHKREEDERHQVRRSMRTSSARKMYSVVLKVTKWPEAVIQAEQARRDDASQDKEDSGNDHAESGNGVVASSMSQPEVGGQYFLTSALTSGKRAGSHITPLANDFAMDIDPSEVPLSPTSISQPMKKLFPPDSSSQDSEAAMKSESHTSPRNHQARRQSGDAERNAKVRDGKLSPSHERHLTANVNDKTEPIDSVPHTITSILESVTGIPAVLNANENIRTEPARSILDRDGAPEHSESLKRTEMQERYVPNDLPERSSQDAEMKLAESDDIIKTASQKWSETTHLKNDAHGIRSKAKPSVTHSTDTEMEEAPTKEASFMPTTIGGTTQSMSDPVTSSLLEIRNNRPASPSKERVAGSEMRELRPQRKPKPAPVSPIPEILDDDFTPGQPGYQAAKNLLRLQWDKEEGTLTLQRPRPSRSDDPNILIPGFGEAASSGVRRSRVTLGVSSPSKESVTAKGAQGSREPKPLRRHSSHAVEKPTISPEENDGTAGENDDPPTRSHSEPPVSEAAARTHGDISDESKDDVGGNLLKGNKRRLPRSVFGTGATEVDFVHSGRRNVRAKSEDFSDEPTLTPGESTPQPEDSMCPFCNKSLADIKRVILEIRESLPCPEDELLEKHAVLCSEWTNEYSEDEASDVDDKDRPALPAYIENCSLESLKKRLELLDNLPADGQLPPGIDASAIFGTLTDPSVFEASLEAAATEEDKVAAEENIVFAMRQIQEEYFTIVDILDSREAKEEAKNLEQDGDKKPHTHSYNPLEPEDPVAWEDKKEADLYGFTYDPKKEKRGNQDPIQQQDSKAYHIRRDLRSRTNRSMELKTHPGYEYRDPRTANMEPKLTRRRMQNNQEKTQPASRDVSAPPTISVAGPSAGATPSGTSTPGVGVDGQPIKRKPGRPRINPLPGTQAPPPLLKTKSVDAISRHPLAQAQTAQNMDGLGALSSLNNSAGLPMPALVQGFQGTYQNLAPPSNTHHSIAKLKYSVANRGRVQNIISRPGTATPGGSTPTPQLDPMSHSAPVSPRPLALGSNLVPHVPQDAEDSDGSASVDDSMTDSDAPPRPARGRGRGGRPRGRARGTSGRGGRPRGTGRGPGRPRGSRAQPRGGVPVNPHVPAIPYMPANQTPAHPLQDSLEARAMANMVAEAEAQRQRIASSDQTSFVPPTGESTVQVHASNSFTEATPPPQNLNPDDTPVTPDQRSRNSVTPHSIAGSIGSSTTSRRGRGRTYKTPTSSYEEAGTRNTLEDEFAAAGEVDMGKRKRSLTANAYTPPEPKRFRRRTSIGGATDTVTEDGEEDRMSVTTGGFTQGSVELFAPQETVDPPSGLQEIVDLPAGTQEEVNPPARTQESAEPVQKQETPTPTM